MTPGPEYVKECERELRSAIAPLTAPNPHDAAKIEAAIAKVIDAKISLAISNLPRGGFTESF